MHLLDMVIQLVFPGKRTASDCLTPVASAYRAPMFWTFGRVSSIVVPLEVVPAAEGLVAVGGGALEDVNVGLIGTCDRSDRWTGSNIPHYDRLWRRF
jgi:hypothetical protein